MSRTPTLDRLAYNSERFANLEAEIARLRAENEQLMEQIALRQPSVVERDMQLVMQSNNKLRVALEAQLEAHNYAEVIEIARKALANEKE